MPSLSSPFELIVWQDVDESKHPLSTTPILSRMLKGSQVKVGDHFRFSEVFGEAGLHQVALLYPLQGKPPIPQESLSRDIDKVLVLDGTWRKVKRLLLLNPWLQDLPHIHLAGLPESRYHRQSHQEGGVSTLEAVLYLCHQVDADEGFLSGLDVLDRMSELQNQFKKS